MRWYKEVMKSVRTIASATHVHFTGESGFTYTFLPPKLVTPGKPIVIKDFDTERPVATFDGASIQSIAFSKDGKRVALGGNRDIKQGVQPVVDVYETATQRQLAQIRTDDIPKAMAFNPDGKQIVIGNREHSEIRKGSAALYEIESGKKTGDINTDNGTVRHLEFSPNGQKLALTVDRSNDGGYVPRHGAFILYDWPTQRRTFSACSDTSANLAFDPSGSKIVRKADGAEHFMRNLSSGRSFNLFLGHTKILRFSPDGNRLAALQENRILEICDLNTGHKSQLHLGDVRALPVSLAFTPAGQLAVGFNNQAVLIFDAPAAA